MREIQSLLIRPEVVSGKNWWYFTVEQLKGWGVKFHTLRTGVKFRRYIR